MHIAAHGEVTDDEATTGVVIGGQFHLTAKVFASLSVVPDLVFLNACHVGQIPNRDLKGVNRVAATVAESLLRIGVAGRHRGRLGGQRHGREVLRHQPVPRRCSTAVTSARPSSRPARRRRRRPLSP